MEIIRNAKGFNELHIGNHVYNLSSLIEELIDANKEYDIEATFLRMMDAFIFWRKLLILPYEKIGPYCRFRFCALCLCAGLSTRGAT